MRGLTRVPVSSEEEALAQFFVGEQGRATAGHVLNAASSRSHTIFTVHLEVRRGVLHACMRACVSARESTAARGCMWASRCSAHAMPPHAACPR